MANPLLLLYNNNACGCASLLQWKEDSGLPMTRDNRQRLMPACLGVPGEHLASEAVPANKQLATKIRKVKRGKAPGPDSLPAKIFKAGAAPMIQHVAALTTKTALHAREPDSWRSCATL